MTKAVIFDFDGVIADSLDFVLEVTNSYLTKWGKEPIAKEEYRQNDVEELYRSNRTNWFEEIFLLWKIRSAIHRNLRKIPVHKHIVPVLKETSGEVSLSLLTSNSKTNVFDFLKVHHIHNYFIDVHTNFMMFNKDQGLRTIIQRERISSQETLYIGDEPRDIRAARKVGARAVAVDWGYSNRRLLETAGPDAIASSSKELLRIIEVL